MANETTTKLEREYIIPLRAKVRSAVRYKKANKAVRVIKEFLAKHMKVIDRDLNKIKLDLAVNEAVWARGIKNPIHKIKVKAVKEGDIVRVTLVEMSKKATAKKKAIEGRETKSKSKSTGKAKDTKPEVADKDKDGVNDKLEEKEDKKATEEKGKKEEKAESKANKKTTDEQKKKDKSQPQQHIAK